MRDLRPSSPSIAIGATQCRQTVHVRQTTPLAKQFKGGLRLRRVGEMEVMQRKHEFECENNADMKRTVSKLFT